MSNILRLRRNIFKANNFYKTKERTLLDQSDRFLEGTCPISICFKWFNGSISSGKLHCRQGCDMTDIS